MDITDLNPEKNRSEIELRAAVDACIKFTAASVIVKGTTYRRATGPHAIPSLPLDKFLQLLVVVLAKLVTDGLYKIGQLALVASGINHQVGHLAA